MRCEASLVKREVAVLSLASVSRRRTESEFSRDQKPARPPKVGVTCDR